MAEVLVLGPVALADSAGPVTPPAMLQRLVAGLVIADGRVCQTDELLHLLWGDDPPPSARKLVRVYVSQLRKALPARVTVETVGGGYALRLPADALDADRFERLVGEATAARRDGGNPALTASLVDQALAIWRGRAFGELAYEEVARAESERLEELRLVALEERLEAHLALGRHADALGDALALADEHPYRERAHELAMLALYRCGRQIEALDRFTELRRRLDEELGLEPGHELRELQRRILQQDATLDVAAPPSESVEALPVPPTPLVGREAELESLREILLRREVRLLVLTGAGGSGKTRLALEAVRELASTYANGAVLVELAPLRDPELVLPTIAQRMDVSAVPGQELLNTLVAAVRGRELLLVLDNAEHLRGAAPLFAELVARVPRLTLLVTSRAVLHLSGEHVVPVPPLEDEAAVELFEQRARALAPTFRATTDNRAAIGEVCARVDRLPLAIELAAGRIGTLSLSALRDRLGDRLAILTGGPRDLPARQQTLRETLDWSVGLLTPAARAVLARLAVFPGGATLEAAEEVCRADLDTLATLVDAHLVLRVDVGEAPRFGLLETVRAYALELLGDERRTTQLALAAWFGDLVDHADFRGRDHGVELGRMDAEVDNLRAALDFAASAGDGHLELRIAGGLQRFWMTRSPVEGRGRIDGALERASSEATWPRARALQAGAYLAAKTGDYERAKTLAREAISVAAQVGSLEHESDAYNVLGMVGSAERDFASARAHYARAAALQVQMGREPVVQRLNLAVTMLADGDPAGAVPLFESVLEHYLRDAELGEMQGVAHLNLGEARFRLGEREVARAHYEAAYRSFAAIGFRAHIGHALQGLAAVAAESGLNEAAAELLGRAAAKFEGTQWIGDVEDLATAAASTARAALGDEAFEVAYAAGRAGLAMRMLDRPAGETP